MVLTHWPLAASSTQRRTAPRSCSIQKISPPPSLTPVGRWSPLATLTATYASLVVLTLPTAVLVWRSRASNIAESSTSPVSPTHERSR